MSFVLGLLVETVMVSVVVLCPSSVSVSLWVFPSVASSPWNVSSHGVELQMVFPLVAVTVAPGGSVLMMIVVDCVCCC